MLSEPSRVDLPPPHTMRRRREPIRRYQGPIDGGGTITVTLDGQDNVTSFDVDAVPGARVLSSGNTVRFAHVLRTRDASRPVCSRSPHTPRWRSRYGHRHARPAGVDGHAAIRRCPVRRLSNCNTVVRIGGFGAVGGLTKLSQQPRALPASGHDRALAVHRHRRAGARRHCDTCRYPCAASRASDAPSCLQRRQDALRRLFDQVALLVEVRPNQTMCSTSIRSSSLLR